MSNWPFRFIHAADLHLERPPFGVSEVPDHLRELFLESSYLAAARVFETAAQERAEFLVLSGDVLDPLRTGPRGPRFLIEQFERLAERSVRVYWAGGRVDPPEAWPAALSLPRNVRVFSAGHPQEFIHRRDDVPLARLLGASRTRGRSFRASDFDAEPTELFSIAVAYGSPKAESLRPRAVDYWALGGRHGARALLSTPHVALYPGTPQGRQPSETGPHGCTLVDVDGQGHVRTTTIPTDVMRWQDERIVVDEATARDDLESQLHQRMHALVDGLAGRDLLVSWTIAGDGPLVAELRRGSVAAELLNTLRKDYGFGPPAAWSVSLSVEAAATLPAPWYEQETILGDFLRRVRHYQMNADEPIELEGYLSEEQLAGSLGAVATIAGQTTRQTVLREAAALGIDLLSGEEPQS